MPAKFRTPLLVAVLAAALGVVWWAGRAPPPLDPATLEGAPILAVAGDVNLSRRQHLHTAKAGPAAALAQVPQLARADLAFVNLESVVATVGRSGRDKGDGGFFYFRGRPELLEILVEAGVDVVGTANNHAGDYGPEALLEQGRILDGMGMAHAGSGPDRETACRPVLRHAGELTVAFFSLSSVQPEYAATDGAPGICFLPLDDPSAWRELLEPGIAGARETADLVMVAVHWGPNNAVEPSADELEVGHEIIESGADAVLGSSAHVLQGIEIHQGRPILHDTGNLLFDFSKEAGRASGVFSLVLGPQGVLQVRFVPVVSGAGVSFVPPAERAAAILSTLEERSSKLGTDVRIEGGQALVDLPEPPPRARPPQPAPEDPPRGPTPVALSDPPAHCIASEVPPEARIEPIDIGPLQLIGLRMDKNTLTRPELVGVDSYWTLREPTELDLVIYERFVPAGPDKQNTWGNDHDPCDWQWPTSRWSVDTVYRDQIVVRPPGKFRSGEYELRVGLVHNGERVGPRPVVGSLRIDAG